MRDIEVIATSELKQRITFEETQSNMVNYRNEGGVVYIVVKVAPDNQRKMYYVKLMPFYINKLLEIYKNRKKVKFPLKLFLEDAKKVETVFLSFLQDRKKQPTSFGGRNWTIEEIVRQFNNEDWKFRLSSMFLNEMETKEKEAIMSMLYSSVIYDKITDVETGLYRESPAYVYGLLQDEINFGKIIQAEL